MERYKIMEKIGQGSQAVAYLAKRKENGEKVVLKRIPVGNLSRTEVKVMLRLRHPHIIQCYESFEYEENIYLVLQYADGGDIERYINKLEKANKKPDVGLVLEWFAQIGAALQYCHSQQVIHRDVKPGNIFLSKDLKTVYLGDFGVAKHLEKPSSVASTLVGSPVNLSPEVISGVSYSYTSDVWSLGCVLYEMYTLRKPFQSPNFAQLVMRVCSGHYDPLPPDTPDFISRAIAGMLNIEAKDRWLISEVFESHPEFEQRARAVKQRVHKRAAATDPQQQQLQQQLLDKQKAPNRQSAAARAPAASSNAEGGSEDDEEEPLAAWYGWKMREFAEIDAFLHSYPDHQEIQLDYEDAVPEWKRSKPHTPELNANRAKRMLPSPQVASSANVVLNGASSGGGRPYNHSAPAIPGPANQQPANQQQNRQSGMGRAGPPLAPQPNAGGALLKQNQSADFSSPQPLQKPPPQQAHQQQQLQNDEPQTPTKLGRPSQGPAIPSPQQAARAEKRAEERRQMMRDRQQRAGANQQGDLAPSDIVVEVKEPKMKPPKPYTFGPDAPQQQQPQTSAASSSGLPPAHPSRQQPQPKVSQQQQQQQQHSGGGIQVHQAPSQQQQQQQPQGNRSPPQKQNSAPNVTDASPSGNAKRAQERQGLKDMIKEKRESQKNKQSQNYVPDVQIHLPGNLQHLLHAAV